MQEGVKMLSQISTIFPHGYYIIKRDKRSFRDVGAVYI